MDLPNQKLFEHMQDEHGLTLVEHEMNEIIRHANSPELVRLRAWVAEREKRIKELERIEEKARNLVSSVDPDALNILHTAGIPKGLVHLQVGVISLMKLDLALSEPPHRRRDRAQTF